MSESGPITGSAGILPAFGRKTPARCRRSQFSRLLFTLPFSFFALSLLVPLRAVQIPPVITPAANNQLAYVADAQGNRVPDFSHAGYKGGGVPLPDVPVRVVLAPPAPGTDATALIQTAIDQVAQLKPDANGHRGTVLLQKGRYEISGQLRIASGGVVLRGMGSDKNDTVLIATGWDRRPLILVLNKHNVHVGPFHAMLGVERKLADDYVPVGSTKLRFHKDSTYGGFEAGTRIRITRPSTKEWIEAVGMHVAPGRQNYDWPPDSVNIEWNRVVTSVESDGDTFVVTLDAPITTALEKRYGGAEARDYGTLGEISQGGIENMRCESAFDSANPLDEQHSWIAIAVDYTRDFWVSNVTAVHFASSAVDLGANTSRITVQDCASLAPVSELGGYRRHAFTTSGQQTLFLRCYSEDAMHDFTTGYLAAGPNAFVECTAKNSHGDSGSIGSWASGSLFDNVNIDGAGIALTNLETWNQGVGWASANSMIWQCSAATITCRLPPTAQNWACGPWAQFVGDGHWIQVNEYVKPDSLYRAQLTARPGVNSLAALDTRTYSTAIPKNLTALPELPSYDAHFNHDIPLPPLALTNGWLGLNFSDKKNLVLGGSPRPIRYWRDTLVPSRVYDENGSSITRFAPGRFRLGLTDQLDGVGGLADDMLQKGQVILRHHYGLWYERRRDDHERVRRPDADVWPPFFEQPFARSGQGRAWDGLSKYDLTKYNPWYFGRIREFARLARDKGLVLYSETFFQHNILEAGAHWVDTPWRPANALQDLGFPEPVPFTEGGKRIHMADTFYDVSHPARREIYRAYIRQCLQNLADQPNVIHSLTNENTGPLHFMQFWLDVVDEWIRETGRRPLIALSATKDVQDAILADPRRAALISVIDLKYWWYTDTTLYAPEGGKNLSPRQHERLWKGRRPGPAAVARMIREYRENFPGKAILCHFFDGDNEWANLAAGASLPQLSQKLRPALSTALSQMRPLAGETAANSAAPAKQRQWTLAAPGEQYFAVAIDDAPVVFDLTAISATTRFTAHHINPDTGEITRTETLSAARRITISSTGKTTIIWLAKVEADVPAALHLDSPNAQPKRS